MKFIICQSILVYLSIADHGAGIGLVLTGDVNLLIVIRDDAKIVNVYFECFSGLTTKARE